MAAISSGVGVVVGGTVVIAAYLLPIIIAGVRRVVNIGSVFAINLLLGWTFVGWVVALAMALRTNPPHAYPQWWGAQASAPPPGWYPDPTGSGRTLWWDGQQWHDPPSPLP